MASANDQPGQVQWLQFGLKCLNLILVTLFSISLNETE